MISKHVGIVLVTTLLLLFSTRIAWPRPRLGARHARFRFALAIGSRALLRLGVAAAPPLGRAVVVVASILRVGTPVIIAE